MSKCTFEGVVMTAIMREKSSYSAAEILELKIDTGSGVRVIQMTSTRFKGAIPTDGDVVAGEGKEHKDGYVAAKLVQNLTTGVRCKA